MVSDFIGNKQENANNVLINFFLKDDHIERFNASRSVSIF